MKTLAQVENDNGLISLLKLTDKQIVDIEGYISSEWNSSHFAIVNIIFADGSRFSVEGEHDLAYIAEDLGDEQLEALLEEDSNRD